MPAMSVRPPPVARRVVRVITRLNVGGPARHVALLNGALQARGHSPLLVYGELAENERALDDNVSPQGFPSIRIRSLRRTVNPIHDARAFAAIVRVIFRVRPHIVHTHTSKAGVLGRLAAGVYNATRRRSNRALIVHTFHGNVLSGYFGSIGSLAARLIERALAGMSDRLVALSPQQRDEIVRRFRIAPADKVTIVFPGLDLSALLEVPPPAVRQELVLGFIGRLVPIKDVGTLLRAFAEVRAASPDTRLLIAGGGESQPQLEQLVNQLGIAADVHFMGWTADLPAFYAGVDICVLSSLNEGTPYSLIEAMAAGRPVVATSVGGVPDVVTAGRTGLLVPPGDPHALAEAMLALVRDPELRRALAEAGRASVPERFGAGRLVADTLALYDTLRS